MTVWKEHVRHIRWLIQDLGKLSLNSGSEAVNKRGQLTHMQLCWSDKMDFPSCTGPGHGTRLSQYNSTYSKIWRIHHNARKPCGEACSNPWECICECHKVKSGQHEGSMGACCCAISWRTVACCSRPVTCVSMSVVVIYKEAADAWPVTWWRVAVSRWARGQWAGGQWAGGQWAGGQWPVAGGRWAGEQVAGGRWAGEPVAGEPVSRWAGEPVAGGRWPARGNDYSVQMLLIKLLFWASLALSREPSTLSCHLVSNPGTFRTWTCGIMAAESDRCFFKSKGQFSGSMCFCIAFGTEKILITMLWVVAFLAMRWWRLGPSCGKNKKTYQRWFMLVLQTQRHKYHKSPIVDSLCLCVSCKLGSQWGWFLAFDLPLSTHILIVSLNNCLSSLQHPILSLVPCRHAPRKV